MIQDPEQLHQDWKDAYNEHDIEVLVQLYEEEAVMVSGPAEGHISGRENIRQLLKGFLSLDGTIEIRTLQVIPCGNLALLFSDWQIDVGHGEHSSIELSGRGTELVRRQDDDTWKYVIDHPWGAV